MPVRRRDGSRLYTPQDPWISAIHVLADQEADLSPSDTFHGAHRFSVSLLRDPADGRLLAKAFLGHSEEIREAFETFCATQGMARQRSGGCSCALLCASRFPGRL